MEVDDNPESESKASRFSGDALEYSTPPNPSQRVPTDPMGPYIQYGSDGGIVRKNTPGMIWAHGESFGDFDFRSVRNFSRTPILQFWTAYPRPYVLVA